MSNFPIADELKKRIPIKKVLIENDANAAAFGEALAGAGKGLKNVIMITLGTGVGGGIVIDGKLYSGFNYAGAELGHTVIEVDGKVIGYLHDGRDVVVMDTVDGWALVCNPDDLQDPLGWVCMDYIHVYGGDVDFKTAERQSQKKMLF